MGTEKKGDVHNPKRLREITGILVKHNIVAGITPQKLIALLEDLGPTFIKIGQLMSMQPILPVEYCRELAKLRAQVTPMPFREVQEILQEEYGSDWSKIFVSLEADPLGSASIAQVHKATLLGGFRVVVKVQRPGIYETMASDIDLLRKAAKIIKYTPISHTVDLQMVLDEMWTISKQEMDFLVELENIREFRKNNENINYIACPQVVSEYSTSKVLVMEYIQGPFINNLEVLGSEGYDLDEIARKLAHNFVKQVVEDGFFHADPHTGNIIIRDGKIVWIDLGMMGRLSNRDMKLFLSAISAIADNDISGLKDFVLSMGQYSGKIDHLILSDDLERFLLRFGAEDFTAMDLSQVTDALFSILGKHGIKFPKGVTMLFRSMTTLQGTLRSISGSINFIGVLSEYMSNRVLHDIDLRETLKMFLKSLSKSIKKSIDIPAQLSDSLKLLSKGDTRVHMELNMSNPMDARINKMLNKLVVSIILAALLVGSCLICTTDMRPKILGIPAIGFIGFGASSILGFWLVISILSSNHRR